jgi:hypothetical protein
MKIAIVFKGGVSKKIGSLEYPGQIDIESEFVNYKSAHNSFKKHIIDANNSHEIDTLIPCWHPELEEDLKELYNPTQILTEQNSKYKAIILYKLVISNCDKSCFATVSQALSLKKVCEMTSKYCTERNFKYDLVLVYRLDLMLIKNMIFEEYDFNAITCNKWEGLKGDFHFVMNYENMLKFSKMYDNFSLDLQPVVHQCTRQYVSDILKLPYKDDDIVAGKHQEIMRKALNLVTHNHSSFEELNKYGVTREEILSYNF